MKYRNKNTTRTTADGRTIKFRSKLEAKWSRYLDILVAAGEIRGWRYESTFFEFLEIKHGIRRYKPDFEVALPDGRTVWHECKGYLDAKSITKIRRFAKYYPKERLDLIFNVVPKPGSRSKKRIEIEKISPYVYRVIDAAVIFKQLGIK